MNAEELKKELGGAIESLQTKMDESINVKAKEIETASAKERKALADEFKKDFEAKSETLKKMQEQLDTLEVKQGRISDTRKKSIKLMVKDAITGSDSLNQFKSGNSQKATIDMPDGFFSKTDDMTQANSFESTAVVRPDYVPGIFFNPDRTWHVRDIMPVGTTNSNAVPVVREYAYSDASDITVEGAEYKQSDFDLKMTSATVYKITNYIIASEEMLEDVDGLTSYIYTRLPSKLKNKEDYQLLYGTGSSEISGLITNATAYSENLADAAVQLIDVLADGVRQCKVAEYMPTAILMNPADVTKYLLLEKDSTNRYLSPWVFTNETPTIAGVPVLQTTAITAGAFFIGDFSQAGQIFDRRQATIEITNTNEDNFVKGMLTVRAAERLALAIYRPSAFIYGTIAAALANGSA